MRTHDYGKEDFDARIYRAWGVYNKILYGLLTIDEKKDVCEVCVLAYNTVNPSRKEKAWRAREPLECVHTNVCGQMKTLSHAGNRYFIIFIDDYSRMTWVYFMRQKIGGVYNF